MKFKEFVEFAVKNSVGLIYDDSYGAGIIVKEMMKLFKDGDVYYIIFTDMNDIRTKKFFENLSKVDEKIGEVLKNVKAIKIGRSKEVFNNNLFAYIEMVEDIEGVFHDLASIVKKLDEKALIVYDGMFLFYRICGEKVFFENLEKFISSIGNFRGVTLIPIMSEVDESIAYLFDLVLSVKKSEKLYSMGRREYEVEILHSIFPQLPPLLAFKIIQDEIVEV
ncbi:hypothetical protein [Ferroglobus placidus]|uniref:hypothetical protein n=1 Tax=Ferroglobus placidus TaxID=54261 RepID=UPI0011D08BD9|nr:hypothetical protein [Ferroglobus placidus]